MEDSPNFNISRFFLSTHSYIHKALACGEKVLVHDFAGMAPAATIVAAFLIKEKQISAKRAINLVKKKRAVAKPNPSFAQ